MGIGKRKVHSSSFTIAQQRKLLATKMLHTEHLSGKDVIKRFNELFKTI